MIRLFAALAVPLEMAAALERRQQGLPGARWSLPEQLHITLCFFGEIDEARAADLDAKLAALSTEGFEVAFRGAGAFGEPARMRAVWAGVEESEPLRRLATKCETAAKRCGVRIDARTYRPHVTLAYLKRTPQDRVAAWLQSNNLLHSPPWRARTFGLYSSWRSAEGSRYELERSYPLA
jgi:2'-5' RNA ligase